MKGIKEDGTVCAISEDDKQARAIPCHSVGAKSAGVWSRPFLGVLETWGSRGQ